jgi:hypothetical protein
MMPSPQVFTRRAAFAVNRVRLKAHQKIFEQQTTDYYHADAPCEPAYRDDKLLTSDDFC